MRGKVKLLGRFVVILALLEKNFVFVKASILPGLQVTVIMRHKYVLV